MRPHMNTRNVRAPVAFLLLVLTASLLAWDIGHHRKMDAHEQQLQQLADSAGRQQLWDRADYLQYQSIVDSGNSNGDTLTDDQLNWLLAQMSETTPPKGSHQNDIDSFVIGELLDARLTTSQAHTADTAALPILSRDDPDGLSEQYACKLFGQYPDTRASQQLLTLQNSPHPWVRRDTAIALNRLGYKVTIPPRPTKW